MRVGALTLAGLLGPLGPVLGWRAVSKTQWDCCKPGCGWSANMNRAGASGAMKLCDRNDNPIPSVTPNNINQWASSCTSTASASSNYAYLCSDYQPKPISNDLSLGFVIMEDTRDCCECFQITWLTGPIAGRSMQAQMMSNGAPLGEVIVVMPGGGVNENPLGCQRQYGGAWGDQVGGVPNRDACASLPEKLQGGCYWRWNWALGDMDGWMVDVQNITCPSALTDISGCTPGTIDDSATAVTSSVILK